MSCATALPLVFFIAVFFTPSTSLVIPIQHHHHHHLLAPAVTTPFRPGYGVAVARPNIALGPSVGYRVAPPPPPPPFAGYTLTNGDPNDQLNSAQYGNGFGDEFDHTYDPPGTITIPMPDTQYVPSRQGAGCEMQLPDFQVSVPPANKPHQLHITSIHKK